MKHLSNSDLIKKYAGLLEAPVTLENILELRKVYDEIKTRKEIYLQKADNPRLDFLEGRKQWDEVYVVPADPGCEIGLIVLDKESVPEIKGLRRYALGYALDSTKSFGGDNILSAFDALSFDNFKVDTAIVAKIKDITPFKNGKKLYEVKFGSLLKLEGRGTKPNSAKEIIRKAFDAGCIIMDKALALDLCKIGALAFDIDRYFGVGMDKTYKIIKSKGFMENGIAFSVVYPVNEVDTDGDYATPDEVEKASYEFMKDFQKFNYMHSESLSDWDVSIIACACALADAPQYGVKKGDWYVGVQVHNLELRKKIDTGEITGFSMEGSAMPGEPIKELARRQA